jgi:hypothetical protein
MRKYIGARERKQKEQEISLLSSFSLCVSPLFFSTTFFLIAFYIPRGTEFCEDEVIPNLLVFSPHVDLHDHEMLKSGKIILQVLKRKGEREKRRRE